MNVCPIYLRIRFRVTKAADPPTGATQTKAAAQLRPGEAIIDAITRHASDPVQTNPDIDF
jgi:hypothetical protein